MFLFRKTENKWILEARHEFKRLIRIFNENVAQSEGEKLPEIKGVIEWLDFVANLVELVLVEGALVLHSMI